MNSFVLLDLPTFDDSRGALTVLEGKLPFPVKRIYWVYGADGKARAGHRHHLTRQVLIAVAGKIVVHLDDGQFSDNIILDTPRRCLLVEPKDWHTTTFGPSSVLLVLASHLYDRADYIDTPYEQK